MEQHWTDIVVAAFSEGRHGDAERELRRVIKGRPAQWQPIVRLPDREVVYGWSGEDTSAYVASVYSDEPPLPVYQGQGSLSMAYFLLGCLQFEQGKLKSALYLLEHGLALEPDHPNLLCEKAQVLLKLERPSEALALFQRAETARSWVTKSQKALALRGQGYTLIELGQRGKAYDCLQRSLVYEPGNRVAMSELEHIDPLDGNEATYSRTRASTQSSPQYAVLRLENDTFVEPDPVLRFYSVRAASDRLCQLGAVPPQAMIVRTDLLPQFIGKPIDEVPMFDGLTQGELSALFDANERGDEAETKRLVTRMEQWRKLATTRRLPPSRPAQISC